MLPRINSSRLQENSASNSKVPDEKLEKRTGEIFSEHNKNSADFQTTPSPLVFMTIINKIESRLINLEKESQVFLGRFSENEMRFEEINRKINIMSFTVNNNNNSNNNKSEENGKNSQNKNDENKENGDKDEKEAYQLITLNKKMTYLENAIIKDQEHKNNQRVRDLDMYKSQFEKLNANLANLIQMEVAERFRSDAIQKIANDKAIAAIEQQIKDLRDEVESMTNKMRDDIMDNNNQCSERNHNLVLYMEKQFKSQTEKVNDSSLQIYVEKLTEQVKTNMVNQKEINKSYDNRISLLEKMVPKIQTENSKLLDKVESTIIQKILTIKKYFDTNIKGVEGHLNSRIELLSANTNVNLSFVFEKLQSYFREASTFFSNFQDKMKFDMKTIVKDLIILKDAQNSLITHVDGELSTYTSKFSKYDKKISDFLSGFEVYQVNQGILRNIDNFTITEKIDFLDKGAKIETDKIKQKISEVIENFNKNKEEVNGNIKKLTKNLIDEKKNSSRKFNTVNDHINELTVKQILNEIIEKAKEEKINWELSKINVMNVRISNNKADINVLNDRIVEAFKVLGETKLKGKNLNDMLKEKEERDEVEKVLLSMMNEVSFREIKINMNEKYNLLNSKINKFELSTEAKISESEKKSEEGQKKIAGEVKKVEQSFSNKFLSFAKVFSRFEISAFTEKAFFDSEIKNVYKWLKLLKSEFSKRGSVDSRALSAVIQQVHENNEITKKALANYSDILDNKVTAALERVKRDNLESWERAVEMSVKVTRPEEISRILSSVPPSVLPLADSHRRILDLAFEREEPKPEILAERKILTK